MSLRAIDTYYISQIHIGPPLASPLAKYCHKVPVTMNIYSCVEILIESFEDMSIVHEHLLPNARDVPPRVAITVK